MSMLRVTYRTTPRRAAVMRWLAVISITLSAGWLTFAQTTPPPTGGAGPAPAPAPGNAPAPAATTGPAATQRARFELIPPPGFVKFAVNDRLAVCDAADQQWVRDVLTQTGPATRPTTMPSDLLATLTARRAELAKTIATDLGLSDPAAIDKALNDRIAPQLQRLQSFKPPIYYMPTTRQRIVTALKAGWENPQFHYNRAADDFGYNPNVGLSIDRPMDDAVVLIMYDDSTPPDQRRAKLADQLHQLEGALMNTMSGQSMMGLQTELVRIIEEQGLKALELKPGQEWFGIGVEGVLSGRYVATLTGLPSDRLLEMMVTPDPRNPMRPQMIDLLHLTPPSELNPQYAGAYLDSMRRKSVAAVANWLQKAGDAALPKTLAAIRQTKPADGDALIKVIKDASGVDVSEWLKAQ